MDVPAAAQGGDGTSENRRKGPGKRSAACSHTCTEAASTVDGAPPTNAPCGACKFLRRKCIGGCIFAPHFGSDQGAARFAAVHKVFGASNVSKLLLHIPPNRRHDAVVTISYEAQARLSDPVYGCVSTIIALQQQVASLQAELSMVQTQLMNSRYVTEQDCPHLLFYGPSGSGKKTLIMALLRQIFGPGAGKVKVENKNWKVDRAYHVEMNPSDAGFQDRYVVQEIIEEMAKNRPIDTKGKKGFNGSSALLACINVIVKVLEFIGKKEGLQLPPGFADRIAQQSNRSLRRAILLFETCRVQQYPFAPNQAITPMDWEEYVSEIASGILKEQSPKRFGNNKFYQGHPRFKIIKFSFDFSRENSTVCSLAWSNLIVVLWGLCTINDSFLVFFILWP
ncbi:ATPase family associated protein [Perilla frutescens var. frutescens]|nr:ATPase family associated protein [Perilla frutescens var. frutescens]